VEEGKGDRMANRMAVANSISLGDADKIIGKGEE